MVFVVGRSLVLISAAFCPVIVPTAIVSVTTMFCAFMMRSVMSRGVFVLLTVAVAGVVMAVCEYDSGYAVHQEDEDEKPE